MFLKIFSIALIIIIVVALTLAALGMITWKLFWVIAIIEAILTYYVLPKIRKAL